MIDTNYSISIATNLHNTDPDDLVALMVELGAAHLPPASTDYLHSVISCPTTTMFVARDSNERIIGLAVLGRIVAFSGTKFWLEDVVVSPERQGQNIGKALVLQAVELARAEGASNVNLTNRPHRVAANQLYRKLGFEPVATNYLRLHLKSNTHLQ